MALREQSEEFENSPERNPIDVHNRAHSSEITYNVNSIERLNNIMNNLEDYFNENPLLFENYDDFKKNFNYDKRSWMQKAVLDTFYKNRVLGNKTTDESNSSFNELVWQYNAPVWAWSNNEDYGPIGNNDLFWGILDENKTEDKSETKAKDKSKDKPETKMPEWTVIKEVKEKNSPDSEWFDKVSVTKHYTPEEVEQKNKAKGDKKRVNVKDWLAWLKE